MGARGLRIPRIPRNRSNYTGRKALNDFALALVFHPHPRRLPRRMGSPRAGPPRIHRFVSGGFRPGFPPQKRPRHRSFPPVVRELHPIFSAGKGFGGNNCFLLISFA